MEKSKKTRQNFKIAELGLLKESFEKDSHPGTSEMNRLAGLLNRNEAQINRWFKAMRVKVKKASLKMSREVTSQSGSNVELLGSSIVPEPPSSEIVSSQAQYRLENMKLLSNVPETFNVAGPSNSKMVLLEAYMNTVRQTSSVVGQSSSEMHTTPIVPIIQANNDLLTVKPQAPPNQSIGRKSFIPFTIDNILS
ncbi:Homeobox domain-containing protein [Caenorhabditis elegans]|uniref:Homeobox domain-containing protein n=1 Tax=Caenorhabditis elegans TaxID=6239 RepID=Q69YW8_CAEEL|nr:Homeobox domain-containing protein [Caenorhabditis elegans]CAH10846.1 Homeobox domain-containing protein [Caenorhabditis elegans]|eukprot:NP_001024824.1 C. Elegans Homeobox [Caenorhabditis elegans]